MGARAQGLQDHKQVTLQGHKQALAKGSLSRSDLAVAVAQCWALGSTKHTLCSGKFPLGQALRLGGEGSRQNTVKELP